MYCYLTFNKNKLYKVKNYNSDSYKPHMNNKYIFKSLREYKHKPYKFKFKKVTRLNKIGINRHKSFIMNNKRFKTIHCFYKSKSFINLYFNFKSNKIYLKYYNHYLRGF